MCIVCHNIFMNVPHGECRVSSILFRSPFASQFRLTTDASRTIPCLKCRSRCVGKTATKSRTEIFCAASTISLDRSRAHGSTGDNRFFFNPTDSPTAKQISGRRTSSFYGRAGECYAKDNFTSKSFKCMTSERNPRKTLENIINTSGVVTLLIV